MPSRPPSPGQGNAFRETLASLDPIRPLPGFFGQVGLGLKSLLEASRVVCFTRFYVASKGGHWGNRLRLLPLDGLSSRDGKNAALAWDAVLKELETGKTVLSSADVPALEGMGDFLAFRLEVPSPPGENEEEDESNSLGSAYFILSGQEHFEEKFAPEAPVLGFTFIETAQALFSRWEREEILRLTLRRQESRLSALEAAENIHRALASTLEMESLKEIILRHIIEKAGADRALLFESTPEEGLTCTLALDHYGEKLVPETLRYSQTVVEEAVKTSQPRFTVNAQAEKDLCSRSSVVSLDLKMIFCAPVCFQNDFMGVIYLDSRFVADTAARESIELLEVLAGSMGLVMKVARSHKALIENREALREVEHLKEVEKARAGFTQTLAHEMQAPITVLIENLEVLEKECLKKPEAVKEFLPILKTQATRLAEMAGSLLDIYRIRFRQESLVKQPVPIRECWSRAAEDLAALATRMNVTIESSLPANTRVLGDWDMLATLGRNLVGNAIKFSPKGGTVRLGARTGVPPSVPLPQSPGRRWLVLTVEDPGIGIPEEDLQKIFQVFFRSQTALDQNISGTGLGLAIAQSIVDALDGHIWAERRPEGPGTVFYIALPMA